MCMNKLSNQLLLCNRGLENNFLQIRKLLLGLIESSTALILGKNATLEFLWVDKHKLINFKCILRMWLVK